MSGQAMTARERDYLVKLVRRQAKLQRTMAEQRAIELVSDFETQLDTRYSYDQEEVWRELYAKAEQAIEQVNAAVALRCEELRVPPDFRPKAFCHWSERGRNTLQKERAEMRRVACARIDAMKARAITEIERGAVASETRIVAGAITSEEGTALLAQIQAVPERVMLALDLDTVAAQISGKRLLS